METELSRIVFNLGDFQYHVNIARGAGRGERREGAGLQQ